MTNPLPNSFLLIHASMNATLKPLCCSSMQITSLLFVHSKVLLHRLRLHNLHSSKYNEYVLWMILYVLFKKNFQTKLQSITFYFSKFLWTIVIFLYFYFLLINYGDPFKNSKTFNYKPYSLNFSCCFFLFFNYSVVFIFSIE